VAARVETLADGGLELPELTEDWWCTHPFPTAPDPRHELPDTVQDATSASPRSAASSVRKKDKGKVHQESQGGARGAQCEVRKGEWFFGNERTGFEYDGVQSRPGSAASRHVSATSPGIAHTCLGAL